MKLPGTCTFVSEKHISSDTWTIFPLYQWIKKKRGGGYLKNGDCMYFVKMAMVIVSVFEVTDIKEEGMESSLTLW